MTTISLKLSEELAGRIESAARGRRTTRSALCRAALEKFLTSSRPAKPSLLALSRDLCGAGDSGIGDLSNNSSHMEGFGR